MINKYLNQTESEMETIFGAELVKTIMNQFVANAKTKKNKGSIMTRSNCNLRSNLHNNCNSLNNCNSRSTFGNN